MKHFGREYSTGDVNSEQLIRRPSYQFVLLLVMAVVRLLGEGGVCQTSPTEHVIPFVSNLRRDALRLHESCFASIFHLDIDTH